jgi:RecB family endonuclease NucS
LEQTLIDNLQQFLLELGKGFAFVARQKHIRTETQDFFIDLVFYNYVLKCFVIVELKTDKINHQDIGQLDMYVRMFDDLERKQGDNPTIGILLCTDTDRTIARYSVLHESRQLFASKYLPYLPSEEELAAEIEREKQIIRLKLKDNEL